MALQADNDGFLTGGTPVALDKAGFNRAYQVAQSIKADTAAMRKALLGGASTSAATPSRRAANSPAFSDRQVASIARAIGEKTGKAVAVSTRARGANGRFLPASTVQNAAVISASSRLAEKIAKNAAKATADRDNRGRFIKGSSDDSEKSAGFMGRMWGRVKGRFSGADIAGAAGQAEDDAAQIDPGAAAVKETRELLSPLARAGTGMLKVFGLGRSDEQKKDEATAKKVHVPWYKKILKKLSVDGGESGGGGGLRAKIPGLAAIGGMLGEGGLIGGAALGGWEIGSAIYEKFAPQIGEIVDKSVAFASDAWTTVTKKWDDVVGGWNALTEDIGKKWTDLTTAFGEKFGIVKDIVVEVKDKVIEKGTELYDTARNKTADGFEAVANAPSAAKEWAGNKIDQGKDVVASAFGGGSKGNKLLLQQHMLNSGITDPKEQAMFMAQMDTETGGFRKLEEDLSYRPERLMQMFPRKFKSLDEAKAVVAGGQEAIGNKIYGGRMGNADNEGYKYRGRGYTHLTGRDNYAAAGKELGLDLVNNPDMAADPAIAAKISTWYWKKNKLSGAAQNGDVTAVTKRINGGTNGLADRQKNYSSYLKQGAVTNDTIAAAMPKIQSAAPALASLTIPAAPPIPVASNTGKESSSTTQVIQGNTIGQNMADRAVAQLVTGGMGSYMGSKA